MRLIAKPDGIHRSFELHRKANGGIVGWIDSPLKNGTLHWTFKLFGYHIGTGATKDQCLEWANALYSERVRDEN